MTANLSYAQLEGVWDQAAAGTPYAGSSASPVPGANWDQLMAAIAEAESSGNPTADNATDNGGRQSSFGLWQISTGTHTPPASNWSDPIENADLAIGKLQSQGLGAWGTYDTGAYRSHLSTSTPAVLTSATSGSGSGSGSPYSNVQWWNPFSWLNVPGDAAASTAQTVTTDVTKAAAIALAALAGLGIIGLGLARATHAPEHARDLVQTVAPAAQSAAMLAV